jgi:CrcB protein
MRQIAIDLIHAATFAMLGCWLRMLLTHFTGGWSGVPFRVFYANVVGCAVMGALGTRRAFFIDQFARFNMPRSLLTAGLMSGFCGSLTSFSGWSESASQAILDANVSLWVLIWLLGTASTAFAFILVSRRHDAVDDDVRRDETVATTSSTWMLLVFLITLCVFMTAFKSSAANWTLPPLFAIVGASLRLVAQERLNKTIVLFPLGTLLCNVIGTVLLGVLRRFSAAAEPDIGDEWQKGAISLLPIVGIGFCGALSTVSSMAYETIEVLDRRSAIVYAIATWLLAHGIATLVQLQV